MNDTFDLAAEAEEFLQEAGIVPADLFAEIDPEGPSVELAEFVQVEPIGAHVAAEFDELAPDGAVSMWRRYGSGHLGADGFVRVVDPEQAIESLGEVLPEGVVPMFTTGLGDVIAWIGDGFALYQMRYGIVQLLPAGIGLAGLVRLLQSEAVLDAYFERQPYPEAAERDGVPALDECFGYVPLLALGGEEEAENLERVDLAVHLAIINDLVGPPELVGELFDEGDAEDDPVMDLISAVLAALPEAETDPEDEDEIDIDDVGAYAYVIELDEGALASSYGFIYEQDDASGDQARAVSVDPELIDEELEAYLEHRYDDGEAPAALLLQVDYVESEYEVTFEHDDRGRWRAGGAVGAGGGAAGNAVAASAGADAGELKRLLRPRFGDAD